MGLFEGDHVWRLTGYKVSVICPLSLSPQSARGRRVLGSSKPRRRRKGSLLLGAGINPGASNVAAPAKGLS